MTPPPDPNRIERTLAVHFGHVVVGEKLATGLS